MTPKTIPATSSVDTVGGSFTTSGLSFCAKPAAGEKPGATAIGAFLIISNPLLYIIFIDSTSVIFNATDVGIGDILFCALAIEDGGCVVNSSESDRSAVPVTGGLVDDRIIFDTISVLY